MILSQFYNKSALFRLVQINVKQDLLQTDLKTADDYPDSQKDFTKIKVKLQKIFNLKKNIFANIFMW